MTDNCTLAWNDHRISKVLRDQAVASWMIFELPKGRLLLNLPQCVKIPPQLWRECMKLQRSAMNKLFCKVGKLLCWQSTVAGWVKVCPSMMILHVELCVLGSHFPTWLKNAWHRNELVMIFGLLVDLEMFRVMRGTNPRLCMQLLKHWDVAFDILGILVPLCYWTVDGQNLGVLAFMSLDG